VVISILFILFDLIVKSMKLDFKRRFSVYFENDYFNTLQLQA